MEVTWQSIVMFIGLAGTLTAIQLKAFDWLLRHRLTSIEDHLVSTDRRIEKLEQLVADTRRDYVRRDDWMRFSSTMEVKLDLVSTRLDALFAEYRRGGRDANP